MLVAMLCTFERNVFSPHVTIIIFNTVGVMLRTDDAGQWTLDAGPLSTILYKLTGELKMPKTGASTCINMAYRPNAHLLYIVL